MPTIATRQLFLGASDPHAAHGRRGRFNCRAALSAALAVFSISYPFPVALLSTASHFFVNGLADKFGYALPCCRCCRYYYCFSTFWHLYFYAVIIPFVKLGLVCNLIKFSSFSSWHFPTSLPISANSLFLSLAK